MSALTNIFIGIIYYQDLLTAEKNLRAFELLLANFVKVFTSLMVFVGLCTWWLILNDESRRVAQEETRKQTQLLLTEIDEHKKTDIKLQQTLAMADTANTAKSRFLSNMSHEIRSPLNSIIGYAHILHKDPTIPEHRKQAVETLKRSSEHLSSLIEDILDIARIEARRFELKYEPINFANFIQHLVFIFKTQAEEKGLQFNCYVAHTLPQRVRGDEKRVGQILINLLGNAVKFTQSGEIDFRIGYSSGVANFVISDTGPGIDEEQLETIFQPFIRLNTLTGNANTGSGLGLTISKILADIMGGELTVKSTLGQGSSFAVRLLLPSLPADSEALPEQQIIGYQGNRKKLLVVDDQADHRQIILDILEPLGFYLYEACSGEDCLDKIAETAPDLILLDLSMGGINGTETALQLRQQNHTMPIVVLSANAYASDRLSAVNAGCNDFLSKPIQVEELLRKLKLHLGLVWLSQDDPTTQAALSSDAFNRQLPQPMIDELVNFVRIGDLRGLNKRIDALMPLSAEYRPILLKIKTLAGEFRLGEIRKQLGM